MGQHWKIISIENQIISFIEKDIPIIELENILLERFDSCNYPKIFSSDEFNKYCDRNSVEYNFPNLQWKQIDEFQNLSFLGINTGFERCLKNYYSFPKSNELKNNFLKNLKENEKNNILQIINQTLRKYIKKEVDSIMDFLILFHVENNTKLINQFRSFIKRKYDNQNIYELSDQIKRFFEYIDSDNILYIHKKDYSDRVNISKWEILEIIEDAKFNNFESLSFIKDEEKIPIDDVFIPSEYVKYRKMVCDFFNNFNQDYDDVLPDEIDVFFNDILLINNFEELTTDFYCFSRNEHDYFGEDIQSKLNGILQDNKHMILYLFSNIQAFSKVKINNIFGFGKLLVRYFSIDIPENTLRNILLNNQINKKDKSLVDTFTSKYNLNS